MKSPITAAQAMSHPAVFETINSFGKMAGELCAEVEALTKERDALAERVKAMEPATGERVKVGDSRFESWYGETKIQQMGTKQRYREAYEAGLNEATYLAAIARAEGMLRDN